MLAAAFGGYADIVDRLLDAKAVPDTANDNVSMTAPLSRFRLTFGSPLEGDTPLMAAAKQGHGKCIQQLLHGGADPDITNKVSWPFIISVIRGLIHAVGSIL